VVNARWCERAMEWCWDDITERCRGRRPWEIHWRLVSVRYVNAIVGGRYAQGRVAGLGVEERLGGLRGHAGRGVGVPLFGSGSKVSIVLVRVWGEYGRGRSRGGETCRFLQVDFSEGI